MKPILSVSDHLYRSHVFPCFLQKNIVPQQIGSLKGLVVSASQAGTGPSEARNCPKTCFTKSMGVLLLAKRADLKGLACWYVWDKNLLRKHSSWPRGFLALAFCYGLQWNVWSFPCAQYQPFPCAKKNLGDAPTLHASSPDGSNAELRLFPDILPDFKHLWTLNIQAPFDYSRLRTASPFLSLSSSTTWLDYTVILINHPP